MGLDITAYSRLHEVERDNEYVKEFLEHGHWFEIHDAVLQWQNKEFPGRANGLKAGVYSFCDQLSFRAGSYGGYNEWRDQLANMIGWENAEDYWKDAKPGEPFYDLINFADNEGTIGSEAAAKLARDFVAYDKDAALLDSGFYHSYRLWRMAFTIAADNGAVDFH